MITARVTGSPRKASASALSCSRTMAEICSGAKRRVEASLPSPATTRTSGFLLLHLVAQVGEVGLQPRVGPRPPDQPLCVIHRVLRVGRDLVLRRLADEVPSPFEKATHDGVVRAPSELAITSIRPAPGWHTATAEYVVPRSMPTTRPDDDAALFSLPSAFSFLRRPSPSSAATWARAPAPARRGATARRRRRLWRPAAGRRRRRVGQRLCAAVSASTSVMFVGSTARPAAYAFTASAWRPA